MLTQFVGPRAGDVTPIAPAGEITGLFYHRYPGGTCVLRGLVFGRRAGEHATSHVRNR